MPIARSGFRRQSVVRIWIDRSPHCVGSMHSSSCRCCSWSVPPFGVDGAVVAVFSSSATANTATLLNPATDVAKRHTAADGGRVTTP